MPRSKTTPEERSLAVRKANRNARKGYKTNLKKRTKVSDEELTLIKDMLVSLKLVGYSNTQCASIVGLSKGQVKEAVSDPNFQSRLVALKKKLPEAAYNLGQAYLVESVQWVLHVGRTSEDGALILKAAGEMFDRFGIPKVSKTESKIETPNGNSTDEIPETLMTKLRAAAPEVQEKVAALQESFTEGIERILTEGNENEPDEA
jgi:hypothetical protein